MQLLPWQIWMMLGIGFIIIEIFDPAFFFFSLGIGAIITSLLSLIPFLGTIVTNCLKIDDLFLLDKK